MAVLDELLQLLGGGGQPNLVRGGALPGMSPLSPYAVPPGSADQSPSDTSSIVLPYLQDVLSGKIAAGGVENTYDPNRSFAANALDPRGIEQATNLATAFSGGGLGIRAYHGSPHSFDRFDLSKIGTGEGAQAYGHGLYFAESEPVARSYRDALAKPMQMNDPVGNAWDLLNKGGFSKQELLDQFNQMAKAFPDKNFWQDSIDAVKSGAVDRYKPPGHMYEVDINAKPEDFLNWDKPLGQQSPTVQGAVEKLFAGNPEIQSALPQATGESIIRRLMPMSGYGRGGPEVRPDVISDALGEAGIPGTRYADQGSRFNPAALPDNPIANEAREFLKIANGDSVAALKAFQDSNPISRWGASERDEVRKVIEAAARPQTSNYAIWTPEIITIMRRYGLLPPLAAGGLLAAPGQGEAAQP